MTQLLPPKKEVALALLERSNVDVYLDPRARAVVVPPQFRKEPRLILKIGLNMPVPIPDLRLDEESMSCTLSFNRSPFYCVVPWSSVFAMVGEDGRGMVWPDDVPQELAVKAVDPADQRPSSPPSPPSSRSDAALPSAGSSSGSGNGRRTARGSKLADDSSARDSVASRGGAKKKKTKKDEVARPMLVAVPSSKSDQREEPTEEAERLREPRPRGAPERREGVSAIPSSQGSQGAQGSRGAPSSRIPPSPAQGRSEGVRPKRELPPYLRVVK